MRWLRFVALLIFAFLTAYSIPLVIENPSFGNLGPALLMPLTALEGIRRGKLYKENGIQLIIPNRRINFIMPNKQGSSWFATAWFCYKLNLPKDLMFIELQKLQGALNEN